MALDISRMRDNAFLNTPARMEVRDTDGAVMEGVYIEGVSIDSNVYRDTQRRLANKRLRDSTRGRNISAAELEADANELLVAAITGWGGFEDGGQPWPFTTDNAKLLFRGDPHIREQWSLFVNDRANFSDSRKPSAELSKQS